MARLIYLWGRKQPFSYATQSAEIAPKSPAFVESDGLNQTMSFHRVLKLIESPDFSKCSTVKALLDGEVWTRSSCDVKTAALCQYSFVGAELCLPQGHLFC